MLSFIRTRVQAGLSSLFYRWSNMNSNHASFLDFCSHMFCKTSHSRKFSVPVPENSQKICIYEETEWVILRYLLFYCSHGVLAHLLTFTAASIRYQSVYQPSLSLLLFLFLPHLFNLYPSLHGDCLGVDLTAKNKHT